MAITENSGLSQDLIANLLANTRTRNAYGPKLVEFLDSDEAGVNPVEVWPEFAGKKATTLYQGFRLAAEKASLTEQLLIKLSEETVFILNKEKVAVMLAERQQNGAVTTS